MTVEIWLSALLAGFLLDLLLGDPHWAPHPVRAMGWLIGKLEGALRPLAHSPRGELAAGAALAVLVPLISGGLALALVLACAAVSPVLAFAVQSVLDYQLLAARALRDESVSVYRRLRAGDLPGARRAVSMIVGRDTDCLDEAGVTRAAVETVAENTSDGVIAPLLYMALGGAPLGMVYKAVNTMDSMVGYKNERYLYFGRAAARLDDVFNWIPARLAGLLLCAGAALSGLNARGALRVFLRDRRRHTSPNSAHTEAACAGALGVRLAGPNRYFGAVVDKPYIGEARRAIVPGDILLANRLMYAGAVLALGLFCLVPLSLLIFG